MSSAMPTAEESSPSRWTLPRWVIRVVRLVPLLGVAAAVVTWWRLPHMRLEPALVGLACWTVGNYLICPLRWQSVSTRGRSLAWYARIFAEGELLGMLTPQHAGADLWRIRQLMHAGSEKGAAVVEIAADRLSGGVMIVILGVIAGMSVPAKWWPIAGGVAAILAAAVWFTRRLWRPRLEGVQLPRGWAFARSAAISALYQLGYLGFILGLVAAVGHQVDPIGTMSVLGLSQAAAMLPGIHGAGPKEGAMAGGLMALGLPVTAAISAVALGAALAWVPAVVVGGGGLAVRGLRRRR
jgi:glycosyltransferase 2 family protein